METRIDRPGFSSGPQPLAKVGIEPGDGASDAVAVVGGFGEMVAFVLVND